MAGKVAGMVVVVGERGDTPVLPHPTVTPSATIHTPTRPAEFRVQDKKVPRYDKWFEVEQGFQWGRGT